MAQTCDSPKTFLATEALAAFRRVKLSSGSGTAVEYADQSDSSSYLGITTHSAAIGEQVAVELKGVTKTLKATAADSFAAGAILYAANDGKVSDSSSGNAIGTALEAAAADGDVVEVILDGGAAAIGSTRLTWAQEDLKPYPIVISKFRVWDAPSTVQPASASSDDLGVIAGTFGSSAPILKTSSAKNTTIGQKTRFQFEVPPEYVPGETITLRVNAGMMTSVANTSCTLDAEVVRQAEPSTDICATNAQSINSLTAVNKDFTITPTYVVVGDILDVVLTIAATDSQNSVEVYGAINSVTMLLDIKG